MHVLENSKNIFLWWDLCSLFMLLKVYLIVSWLKIPGTYGRRSGPAPETRLMLQWTRECVQHRLGQLDLLSLYKRFFLHYSLHALKVMNMSQFVWDLLDLSIAIPASQKPSQSQAKQGGWSPCEAFHMHRNCSSFKYAHPCSPHEYTYSCQAMGFPFSYRRYAHPNASREPRNVLLFLLIQERIKALVIQDSSLHCFLSFVF